MEYYPPSKIHMIHQRKYTIYYEQLQKSLWTKCTYLKLQWLKTCKRKRTINEIFSWKDVNLHQEKKYPQYFHQPLAVVMKVTNPYLYQPLENCAIPHAYLQLIIIKCVFACTCVFCFCIWLSLCATSYLPVKSVKVLCVCLCL